uniref:Ankyrin repeat and SOCS box protein 11 n=1 Tax=Oryzias latipes TaxID=8090 RepID=A0A3P9IJG9_ORYLA
LSQFGIFFFARHPFPPFINTFFFIIFRLFLSQILTFNWWSDRSPLHEAASQGRLLLLRSLVAQGFHVDTLTMDGVSPLHEACLGGHYHCAKFLLENAASADGATPLFNSCRSGSDACVGLLLQHGASVHSTHQLASPMHEAAKKDHRECLELLLACGAQLDTELPEVGSPLYSACGAGAASCVEMLLLAGADVGVGCGRDSPLHAAVQRGDPGVVELLLDFGANAFYGNSEGRTPLDLSAPNSSVRSALQRKGPYSLSQLCRFCIRKRLGRSRLHRAPSLSLPPRMQDFLLYN